MLEYPNGASKESIIDSPVYTIVFSDIVRSRTSLFRARLDVVLIIDSQLAGRAYGRQLSYVSVPITRSAVKW